MSDTADCSRRGSDLQTWSLIRDVDHRRPGEGECWDAAVDIRVQGAAAAFSVSRSSQQVQGCFFCIAI